MMSFRITSLSLAMTLLDFGIFNKILLPILKYDFLQNFIKVFKFFAVRKFRRHVTKEILCQKKRTKK